MISTQEKKRLLSIVYDRSILSVCLCNKRKLNQVEIDSIRCLTINFVDVCMSRIDRLINNLFEEMREIPTEIFLMKVIQKLFCASSYCRLILSPVARTH